jgi:hypothetical protein
MRFDITKLTLGVDQLLPKINNPLHRAILLNYRRHAILEVSGRYEEIFAPDMAAEAQKYRAYGGCIEGGYAEFVGPEVRSLYKGLVDTKTTVMMLENERIAVADWGFASESTFHTFKPGRYVINASGDTIDDPDAIFIESRVQTMVWLYDGRGRLIGEHVYSEQMAKVRKCPPEEIWLVDEVRETLAPLINAPAPLE